MTAFVFDAPKPAPQRKKRGLRSLAVHVWGYTLAAMLAPILVAWALRMSVYAMHCVPGAEACLPPPFTAMFVAALKGLLDYAWISGAVFPVTAALTLLAGSAAILAGRPVSAAATVLFTPLAALLLPVALVGSLTHSGCAVNASGIGDCVLWGRVMGETFHRAATAPELLYTYTPLCVAGSVVAGLLAWIVHWGCRQMRRN